MVLQQPVTIFVYIYDTDTIDYTRNNNKDIINIYYNKAYRK